MNWMPEAVRDGIIVVLIISGPLVLAAAFIGLIIGILQAATQVQEQTIGSALKIIGVFAIIIFAGFWMYQYLNQYTSRTISTAFTFVPKQTQKVIPRQVSDKEMRENFKEKINTEPAEQSLKVIPPEEIETNFPEGGAPPGIPYLGAPEVPKPPSVSKILPAVPPQIPTQVIKPNIPLGFQEPMSVSIPGLPMIAIPEVQQVMPSTDSNKVNDQTENIDGQQINLLPGKPIEKSQEINPELWQRKEVFSEKPNNETIEENTNEIMNNPSWLE